MASPDKIERSARTAWIRTVVLVPLLVIALVAAGFALFYLGERHARITSQSAIAAMQASPQENLSQSSPTHVPFVGCLADGQSGPVEPPRRKDKVVVIPTDLAPELAYYGAGGSGVLAPRGWHCLELYGSDATILLVAPTQLDSSTLFSDAWPGFTGAAIELSDISTDTSGRLEAARAIARVFPAQMAFVKQIEAEGIEGSTSYPVGPFPTDTLKYVNSDVVEYTTLPNQEGLGTLSKLKKSGGPISGVAILRLRKGSLIQLSVRLPDELAAMRPIITQELEHETLRKGVQ